MFRLYPQVAPVSTRREARLHLAVGALAYCGAGTGRILGAARDLTPEDAVRVCRRCARRVGQMVREAIWETARRRDSGAPRRLARLNLTADRLRSPAEVAADRAALAGIVTNVRAAVADAGAVGVPAVAGSDQPALFAAA